MSFNKEDRVFIRMCLRKECTAHKLLKEFPGKQFE